MTLFILSTVLSMLALIVVGSGITILAVQSLVQAFSHKRAPIAPQATQPHEADEVAARRIANREDAGKMPSIATLYIA